MSVADTLVFSATTPSAPAGTVLIVPQDDGGSPTCNQSFYDPLFVGDSGSGGTAGNVPAPPAGSAAAGKFLKADGTFSVPGAGTFLEEVITFSGTSGAFAHAPVRLFGLYRNGIRMTSLGGSPAIQTFSATGTAITLSTAAGGSDVFIAVYQY